MKTAFIEKSVFDDMWDISIYENGRCICAVNCIEISECKQTALNFGAEIEVKG